MINPDARDSYAVLYTRQNEKSLNELKKKGRITNKRIYVMLHMRDIADHFLERYDWFTREAAKRVPKPDDVELPIWCSVSRDNCLKPTEGEIVYVLRVPEENIIYFDGSKWDFALDLHYVPRDMKEHEEYEKHCKSLGIKSSYEFVKGRYQALFPEETKKVIESWPRVFEVDSWNIFSVQANIWEIKEEWVQRIVYPGEEL